MFHELCRLGGFCVRLYARLSCADFVIWFGVIALFCTPVCAWGAKVSIQHHIYIYMLSTSPEIRVLGFFIHNWDFHEQLRCVCVCVCVCMFYVSSYVPGSACHCPLCLLFIALVCGFSPHYFYLAYKIITNLACNLISGAIVTLLSSHLLRHHIQRV